MNPSSPLDQLKDIHPPVDITWWPLAFGWWALIVISVIAIALGLTFFIRHRQRNAWRRLALLELKAITHNSKSWDNFELATEINILLKRCLAGNSSSTTHLSDTADKWGDTLNTTQNKVILPSDLLDILCHEIYQRNCPRINTEQLMLIEKWIRGLRHA